MMNEKEVLLDVMKTVNINQTTLGEKAGYKSKSAITEILNRRGMKVDILLKLLSAMDCELVVKHIPSGQEWNIGES